MGGAAGAVAAAAAARAERYIIEILRAAGATSADKAAPLHPKRLVQRGSLRRLVRAGAVVEAGNETYWLNETAYEAYRSSRRQLVLIVLAAMLVITAAILGASVLFGTR